MSGPGPAEVVAAIAGLIFVISVGAYIGLNRDKPILEPLGYRTDKQREKRLEYFRQGRESALPKVRAVLILSALVVVVAVLLVIFF